MGRIFPIAIILLISFFAMGMEGFSSSDEEFPEPDLNYSATLTDIEGVEHIISMASFSGGSELVGLVGKASFTVDFKKIKRVEIEKIENKTYVLARVWLRGGKQVKLQVKALAKCYGVTELGKMTIRIRDIKSIVFSDEPAAPKVEPEE